MRKLLFLYAVCLLLVFPVVANATPISADLTGTRSTADGGGLTATDGWSGSNNNGFEISWDISCVDSLYTYQYTISGVETEDNNYLSKGLSHWILEVTYPSKATDFTNASSGFTDDSPKPWVTSEDKNPNPYMPASGIYGIKWETAEDDPLTYTVSFDTEKYPVWGDFYAKDGAQGQGNEKIFATAWNLGFGTDLTNDNTNNFTNWIATPDGGSIPPLYVIPEPATMLLLGSGLIGFAVSGKKRFKKRNG